MFHFVHEFVQPEQLRLLFLLDNRTDQCERWNESLGHLLVNNCNRESSNGMSRLDRWFHSVSVYRERCSRAVRELYSPSDLLCHLQLVDGSVRVVSRVVSCWPSSSFPEREGKLSERRDRESMDPTRKQSKRCSSCSGEKSHANFASRSWTFFSIASCLPHEEFQILSRSLRLSACSLMINRRIFSSFSTYCGWWRQSRSTMSSTWLSWIHC